MIRFATLLLCGLGLTACGNDSEQAPEQVSQTLKTSVSQSQPIIQLPVSLNSVMVALVNHAADPIWVAAWHNPETDAEWSALERRAVQLELAGSLLSVPGTGPADKVWTDSADWQSWSNKMKSVGETAVRAVKNRDLEAIALVGDDLVEICEGCHIQFKPALPTGGQFGELSPNAADLED